MEKTVQTLWTGHKSLVRDSFGWLEPQYHLMAWALSCLMLRESYDDVELYTDYWAGAVDGNAEYVCYRKFMMVCFHVWMSSSSV